MYIPPSNSVRNPINISSNVPPPFGQFLAKGRGREASEAFNPWVQRVNEEEGSEATNGPHGRSLCLPRGRVMWASADGGEVRCAGGGYIAELRKAVLQSAP